MSPTDTAAPDDTSQDDATSSDVTVKKLAEPAATRWQRLRNGDRRRMAAVAVVLAVVAGAATWWMLQRDALPDDAALRLGDEVVTTEAVDQRIDALEALYGVEVPTKGSERSDFLRDAAKSMAVQIMLSEEAAEREIVIAEKQVDETLQRLVAERYPDGGRTEFVAALGELGATEGQVRGEIRDQLLVSRLFDEVAGDVTVDDAELRKAFEERREELATPVRRSLRNIVVADEATAGQVLRRLRSGADFASVARSTSLDSATRESGGALGQVSADELEKDYATAAFRAPVGGLFGPVQTESGWNVGKVESELPAAPAEFSAVRDALRQTVLAERSLETWRDWLAEVIASHDVEYAEDYRPDDPDAVPDIDRADVTGGR